MHIKFAVRYLSRMELRVSKSKYNQVTCTRVVDCKSRMKWEPMSEMVRYCSECTKTYNIVLSVMTSTRKTYQSMPRFTPKRSSPLGPWRSSTLFEKNSLPSGPLSLERQMSPSNMSTYVPEVRGLTRHSSRVASMPGILRMEAICSERGR